MAPPHVTKKTTSTRQLTSRRGVYDFQKRITERPDEYVISGDKDEVVAMDEDEDMADALENSQHAPSGELQKLMSSIIDAVC
jgi:hypothetical protein